MAFFVIHSFFSVCRAALEASWLGRAFFSCILSKVRCFHPKRLKIGCCQPFLGLITSKIYHYYFIIINYTINIYQSCFYLRIIWYICGVRKIETIEEYNALFRQPTLHPLVTVGDLSRASRDLFCAEETDFGMYGVILLDDCFGDLIRGDERIECRPGTIVQMKPGLPLAARLNGERNPRGWVLSFRPELLVNTSLGRDFYMFSRFLGHDRGGTLELGEREKDIVISCMANVQTELQSERDYLTNHMVLLGIGQLLSHCKRFYERRYGDAGLQTAGLQARMDAMIDNYLASGLPEQQGVPNVNWCARQMHLSPNYFGDLVKRELKVSAQEYIQNRVVREAQRLLRETTMGIGEIALRIGFTYPNHFTRMFKRRVGMSPMDYRRY